MQDKERPALVKVIARTRSGAYVLSRKRAPGRIKDNRLEFVGGHVDPTDRTAWDAMLREASEEEVSGNMAAALRSQRPTPRAVRVSGCGRDELHYFYEVHLADDAASMLRPGEESYGFESVDAAFVESASRRDPAQFTEKTLRILRALYDES